MALLLFTKMNRDQTDDRCNGIAIYLLYRVNLFRNVCCSLTANSQQPTAHKAYIQPTHFFPSSLTHFCCPPLPPSASSKPIRQTPMTRIPHQLLILRQHPPRNHPPRRRPLLFQPSRQFPRPRLLRCALTPFPFAPSSPFPPPSPPTKTSILLPTASILTVSPSLTTAIGPPTLASGTTCPTMNPWEAPEYRPSVTRATFLSPAPISAAEALSCSGL